MNYEIMRIEFENQQVRKGTVSNWTIVVNTLIFICKKLGRYLRQLT